MCRSYFLSICEYTRTNPFLFRVLRNPEGNAFFEKMLTLFHRYVRGIVQDTSPSRHSKEEFSYMVACTIGSTVGVLHKWTLENCQTPSEFIADILTNTFIAGMLPFMS